MANQLLLALRFYPSSFQQKVIGFRTRFDEKFAHGQDLFLSLMAPFELDNSDELQELLIDDADSFFGENQKTLNLNLGSFNHTRLKKNELVYLPPVIPDELQHFLEVGESHIREMLSKKINYKNSPKHYLPLAHTKSHEQAYNVIQHAKLEFGLNESLFVKDIVLYQKSLFGWHLLNSLHQFENPNDNFLQMQLAPL